MTTDELPSIADLIPVYNEALTTRNDGFNAFYTNVVPKDIIYLANPTNFLKKEFFDLKTSENVPPRKGRKFVPLSQQQFAARFLSPYTPNDSLLLFHEVGVGKTCSASLVVETALLQDPELIQALYVVKNDTLKRNVREEIAKVCTDNKYLPSQYDEKTHKKLSEEAYEARLNKLFKNSYQLETYETLANYLETLTDEEIIQDFSNRVIIVDEIHNIRPQIVKEGKTDVYKQFWRLFHLPRNTKRIGLTATPMRDRPYEICHVLNLLLPIDRQFNRKTFATDYFVDGQFTQDRAKRAEFKTRIRGIVSYVRAVSADAKRINEGTILSVYRNGPGMKHISLSFAKMSDLQSKVYNRAYWKDRSYNPDIQEVSEEEEAEEKSDEKAGDQGIYINSRQSSMFVAPDGSFGSDLVKNGWFIPPKKRAKARPGQKAFSLPLRDRLYHPSKKLVDYLTNNGKLDSKKDFDAVISRLAVCGCKIAGAIREIINNPTEKAFIYCNIVSGGGSYVVAACLEVFGWSHVRLPSKGEGINVNINKFKASKDGPQFMVITGEFPGGKTVNTLVNRVFSNPDNKYGEIIRVIIASKTVGESSSFKACRQFHNLTPGWNETETSQARGRVLRAFAFDVFPVEERYLKTWLWCAMNESTDVSQENVSEKSEEENNEENKEEENNNEESEEENKEESQENKEESDEEKEESEEQNNKEESEEEKEEEEKEEEEKEEEEKEEEEKEESKRQNSKDKIAPSIDFLMYKISEDKDLPIKQVERLLKEAAVDCPINVNRNQRPNIDAKNSRECDYSTCSYPCDSVPDPWFRDNVHPKLITDSYNVLYADTDIAEIHEQLKNIFAREFSLEWRQIVKLFPGITPFVILRALKRLIDTSEPIYNRYGVVCYLREENDLYFLIDNQEFWNTKNMWLFSYYTKSPYIVERMSFPEWLEYFELLYLQEKLELLKTEADNPSKKDSIIYSLHNLPIMIQERILEAMVIAEKQNSKTAESLRKLILQTYSSNLVDIGNNIKVSDLLKLDHNTLRCFDQKEWSDCDKKDINLYINRANLDYTEKKKDNPYGFLGLVDPVKGFKIITIRTGVRTAESTKKADRRIEKKKGVGQACGTGKAFSVKNILGMLLSFTDIAERVGHSPPDLRQELAAKQIKDVQDNCTVKNIWSSYVTKSGDRTTEEEKKESRFPNWTENDIKGFSEDKRQRVYALLRFGTGKTMCQTLRKFFENTGYIVTKVPGETDDSEEKNK